MNLHVYIIITLAFMWANCEWIEITPIENKKQLSNGKYGETTTTEIYESILKTPSEKSVISTSTSSFNEENATIFVEDVNVEKTVTKFPEAATTFNDFLKVSYDSIGYNGNETVGIEGILPFLKVIQTNLLKFKAMHKSKMSVLKNLRDNLLNNIKEIFTNLWRPKTTSEARDYQEEDSHMDFPSNEGALMTIGFLTFAVFLIKLVIKLIHALKYKQQNYGMTSTTTVASVVFLKRRKRDEKEEEMNRILQYIEEF